MGKRNKGRIGDIWKGNRKMREGKEKDIIIWDTEKEKYQREEDTKGKIIFSATGGEWRDMALNT
jgi:hypothetical protein